jgi:hypothetical protein
LIGLLVAFLVIQFIRPAKNKTTNTALQNPNYVTTHYVASAEVANILQRSCNNCHTNNTNYTWYHQVQPVLWYITHHINEGKSELNFDEFATYRLARQYHKFEEIKEQVEENEMPLASYTLMHSEAKLSSNDKVKLIAWADSSMAIMKMKYPMDSLVRKKKS